MTHLAVGRYACDGLEPELDGGQLPVALDALNRVDAHRSLVLVLVLLAAACSGAGESSSDTRDNPRIAFIRIYIYVQF